MEFNYRTDNKACDETQPSVLPSVVESVESVETGRNCSDEEDDEEPEEDHEILGSDNDEQEDRKDYCKGDCRQDLNMLSFSYRLFFI